ncbi:MAG: glycine--tRNA ligase [Candidatus Magasanikbacteria bacterium CG10_big_fil_rev_8_21_14_0_10_36_32]|uniref:glycine--tRNA ligase n=1 Tax=Candidatus Magasanikbacteria bacterium CG10_big_fil_rev_8_21_14_0_10_36_32 TaxID=1974646 RepID=A0A2M6W640_9BACT|nr:MAG: glycine--tRNA ligase [Candidatus Magasanikbacteria bacterium CG10_big_fil_rev_8_21_14_0_10_36_32]
MAVNLEKIVSFAKRRGFIFPSSEIYGGLSASYDFGPLGMELKNNVKKAWLKSMVQNRNDVVGLDSAILMPRIVWEASGHLQSFHDPLVECKSCHHRFRADHLLEAKQAEPGYIKEEPVSIKDINCPDCEGELSAPKNFNLLMKTELGAVEGEKDEAYLRGETCQGIYLNYLNIKESMRQKIPFGIAQVGKAFRNEITTKNFIFRMREFEQMEQQYFINPNGCYNLSFDGRKIGGKPEDWMNYWREQRMNWYLNLGIKQENLRWRQHASDERAHYAKDAWDIEYNTPFGGWKEMAGVHNRGDWDLSRHGEYSKVDMTYTDQESGEKFVPWIIETSDGVDRATLMFLLDAYTEVEARSGEEDAKHNVEVVLKLHKNLAPIKIAILPLSKKEPLQKLSKEIQSRLWSKWMTQYDETGSIGKRYRRQDEIGTPYCLTVDFDSLEDKKVTVRDRDTMEQERISIDGLENYFQEKLNC